MLDLEATAGAQNQWNTRACGESPGEKQSFWKLLANGLRKVWLLTRGDGGLLVKIEEASLARAARPWPGFLENRLGWYVAYQGTKRGTLSSPR